MEKLDAIAALGALAQESRLDIFRLLVQAGPDGIPADGSGAPRAAFGNPVVSPEPTEAGEPRHGPEGKSVADLYGRLSHNEGPAGLPDRKLLSGRCFRVQDRCL